MPPTYAKGKICYIMIPATDIARSSAFYGAVFGWNIRKRNNGSIAFDDGVGQVSGTWVTGRPAPTMIESDSAGLVPTSADIAM